MPLVMISGFPCAGKSYRATQLAEFFTSKIEEAAAIASSTTIPTTIGTSTIITEPSSSSSTNSTPASNTTTTTPSVPVPPLTDAQRRQKGVVGRMKVHVVSDDGLDINRAVYGVVRDEKNARAAEMSAVNRLLSRDTIVIADGMNYIKGFRYQMYCEAKALGTPSCVIHVGATPDLCRERNLSRMESESEDERKKAYPTDIFENLVFRYEEPNGMTRWDSPLFIAVLEDETPDMEGIWNAIVGSEGNIKSIKSSMATALAPTTPQDALQALHTQTTAVLSAIQAFQANDPDGGSVGEDVPIPGSSVPVTLPNKPVMAPQLQRLRRTYVQMRRKGGLVLGGEKKDCPVGKTGGDGAEVNENGYLLGFVDFLNDEFQTGRLGGSTYA